MSVRFAVLPSVTLDVIGVTVSNLGGQCSTLVTVNLDREAAVKAWRDLGAAIDALVEPTVVKAGRS